MHSLRQRLNVRDESAFTLIEPLVAVLVGVFAFHERLTVHGVVGGLLILAGATAVVLQSGPRIVETAR